MNERTLAWLILNHLPGVGAVTMRRLASRFGSPEAALHAPLEELIAVGGLTPRQARALNRLAAQEQRFEDLAAALERAGAHLVTLDEACYPANLRPLRDAPPLLYVRGSLADSDQAAVAIVGTRTPSEEGAAAAAMIAKELALLGVTVVSGLALGVDGAAHRGALAAGGDEGANRLPSGVPIGAGRGGRTIAVLGSGIDYITPRRHRPLAERIARHGALLSETPPGVGASRETLLTRNRIQAGLAKAVIVVQCRMRGGSFSAARRALALARPVFAVRCDEAEFAGGMERLVVMGARAVTAAQAVELAAQAAAAPLATPQGQMSLHHSA